MTYSLLASAPTKEGLTAHIASYFMAAPEEIRLLETGEIDKKGKIASGWRWIKKGNRYRFEDIESKQ